MIASLRSGVAAFGDIGRLRWMIFAGYAGDIGQMDHFLMRGLGKRRGEFSLMTPSCNFKRVMNEPGGAAFAEHCLQKQRLEAVGA